jgi:hypothetical protein
VGCCHFEFSIRICLSLIKIKRRPDSGLDGGCSHIITAQRNYPDLVFGFLLCFFLLSAGSRYIMFALLNKKTCTESPGRSALLVVVPIQAKNPN